MMHLAVAALIALGAAPADLPEHFSAIVAAWGEQDALVNALRAKDKEVTQQVEELMHPRIADDGSEPETLQQPSEEVMKQALQMVNEVRRAYEAALVDYEDNARLHNFYGEWLYDHYGEVPGALREWHKALELDDKLASAYNNLALHNFNYGEYKVGLSQMDKAIKYDKNNPDYLYNLSNVYLAHFPQVGEIRKWDKKKLYREAMKLSKKAAGIATTDYDLLQDYAVNFYAAENMGVEADWEEAAEAWQMARAAAGREDERFYCWLNEARVWLRAERPENAKTCLNEALRIRPDNEIARQLMDSIGGGQSAPASPTPDAAAPTEAPAPEPAETPAPEAKNPKQI